MEMNINEEVWVRLTQGGKKVYRKHFERLGMKPIPRKEILGWSNFQMWDLMNIFGPHLHMGAKAIFKDNRIRFNQPAC